MDEMKKCIQCGADLPGDALFCPDCGARQTAPAAPDTAAKAMAAGSTASYDPFAAQAAPASPGLSNPVQAPPPSPFQPAPAYNPQPAPVTQAPPPAAGFQYAAPKAQQGVPNPYAPQQGMPPQQGMQGGQQQTYQPQPGPMNTPIKPLVKQGGKIPVFLLVVSVILAAGLVFWLLRFFSPDLIYSFGDDTSKGVVFVLILMTILSLVNAGVLRYQMRGKKIAMLANVFLVLIVVALLFGISITEFVDGDLPYNLFIKLVP